jgi:hypothetical protein
MNKFASCAMYVCKYVRTYIHIHMQMHTHTHRDRNRHTQRRHSLTHTHTWTVGWMDGQTERETHILCQVYDSTHWISFTDDIDLELLLARFEHLIERRPLLLNSVLLRQNPHNVQEWHNRVLLYEGKPHEVIPDFLFLHLLSSSYQVLCHVTCGNIDLMARVWGNLRNKLYYEKYT